MTDTTFAMPELDEKEHRAFLRRLKADLRTAASTLTRAEARYIVDTYYQVQRVRTRIGNQVLASSKTGEPNELLAWMKAEMKALEATIQAAMKSFAEQFAVGRWMIDDVFGIGPVISAGLIAHIDITRAPTAGSIWRYAGMDPTREWRSREASKKIVDAALGGKKKITEAVIARVAFEVGLTSERLTEIAKWDWRTNTERKSITKDSLIAAVARRPWNAALKVLCWKAGDSFRKKSTNDKCFYGKLYRQYKENLLERNARGDFKAAAEEGAQRVGKTTEAYKHYIEGRLPPGHLDARALRWTQKLFLSHLHSVAYADHHKRPPPKPYVIAHLDHKDMIWVPAWPFDNIPQSPE